MCGSIIFGSTIVFGSAAIDDIIAEFELNKISNATFQIACFQSLPALLSIFSPYFWNLLLAKLKLRTVASSVGLFGVVSWGLLLLMNKNLFWLGILVRGLNGIVLGGVCTVCPLFENLLAVEGSHGLFGSIHPVGIAVGYVTFSLIGAFHHWQYLIFGSIFFLLILGCLVWIIPEKAIKDQNNGSTLTDLNDELSSKNTVDIGQSSSGIQISKHKSSSIRASKRKEYKNEPQIQDALINEKDQNLTPREEDSNATQPEEKPVFNDSKSTQNDPENPSKPDQNEEPESTKPETAMKSIDDISKDSIFDRKYRRQLIVSMIMMFCAQFSGTGSIIQNTAPLLNKVGLTLDPAFQASIALSAQLFMLLISTFLMDKFGGRTLWIVSSLGMGSSLALYSLNEQFVWSKWIPLISLFGYQLSFGAGLASVPWYLLPENYPVHLRRTVQSIGTSMNWISASIMMFLFPFLEKWLTVFGTMLLFCAINFIVLLFGVLFVRDINMENKKKAKEGDDKDENKQRSPFLRKRRKSQDLLKIDEVLIVDKDSANL